MKRGLKRVSRHTPEAHIGSRARLPDEEGTEIEPRRHIALPICASKLALPFSAV